MAIHRRTFLQAGLALAAAGTARAAAPTGVVLLHGKRGGPTLGPNPELIAKLKAAGIVTAAPTLPWSRERYLAGTWSKAMDEVDAAVKQMKGKADRIVLLGHSMGCPAAMCYAGTHPEIAALALTSPGHNPYGYYQNTPQVRDSIDKARAMVSAGKGAEKATFYDNNQGDVFTLSVTADQYLSYFDPSGPADMRTTAPGVKVPVLWVAGDADTVIRWGAPIAKGLMRTEKSRIIEVPEGTHANAPVIVSAQIVEWVKTI